MKTQQEDEIIWFIKDKGVILVLIPCDIVECKVWPVAIKNCGITYLTLCYYNADDEAILCHIRRIVVFDTYANMQQFCESNGLIIQGEVSVFDYDQSLTNSNDCSEVLNRWNLLNTISNSLEMHFEGNENKYTGLYNVLFQFSTQIGESPIHTWFNRKQQKKLCQVFRKKNRLLNKIINYQLLECDA